MAAVDRTEALTRLGGARSGHLATVRPDGHPHLVVVTFALTEEKVVTAIDHKPKRTTRLQRLTNVDANPSASFLVDQYTDDWSRLWWVRIDGPATVHRDGGVRDAAVGALADKYDQYAERSPEGPVIAVTIDRVTFWSSTG